MMPSNNDFFWNGGQTRPDMAVWNKEPLMVTVKCLVFNHERYLRECLDGIVMQKTNFRFEVVVHDDASTDSSVEIIREYAEKYPEIIKPIIETENLYSKKDGSLTKAVNAACFGKYVSSCEGDDYWIDPLKLQKQYDWMEKHEDYSYCWTNARTRIEDSLNAPYDRYKGTCDSSIQDVILEGGLFVPTCTIFMRRDVIESRPRIKSSTSDYSIQIWGAHCGKVRYMEDITGVYRLMSVGSWTSSQRAMPIEKRLVALEKEFSMLDEMNKRTDYKYDEIIKARKERHYFILYNRYQLVKEAFEHWCLIPNSFKYNGIDRLLKCIPTKFCKKMAIKIYQKIAY